VQETVMVMRGIYNMLRISGVPHLKFEAVCHCRVAKWFLQ